jgi:hypothetical protein
MRLMRRQLPSGTVSVIISLGVVVARGEQLVTLKPGQTESFRINVRNERRREFQ